MFWVLIITIYMNCPPIRFYHNYVRVFLSYTWLFREGCIKWTII